ncbi:DNA-binding protein [Anoxybacillus ayderensis G10]|nr:DNA-binding protein [Anoxybacillus ayderensis G10]
MKNEEKGKEVNPLFRIYTAQEAAELWGLAEPTVRQWIRRGKFRDNEVRKSAGTWLVTHEAMVRVAGETKKKIDS